MQIPYWLRSYLQTEDVQKIEQAVAIAEAKTSGEIIPMIVRRSSTIGHVPFLISSFLIILLLILEVPSKQATYFDYYLLWYFVDLVVIAIVSKYLGQVSFLQRLFSLESDQQIQSEMRAEIEFFEAEIQNTQYSTGILLYVSVMERQAVVLADKAIAEKMPAHTWDEVCQILINGAQQKKIGIAYVNAIQRCGEILSQHFPAPEKNVNELENHLVIKE